MDSPENPKSPLRRGVGLLLRKIFIAFLRIWDQFVYGGRLIVSFFEISQNEEYIPWSKRDSEKHENDMFRGLHFAWHFVVFFPILSVCLTAIIQGANFIDVVFFGALATATVSLEICVGVIFSKANHLADLSRQTRRAYTQIKNQEELRKWTEYFHHKHRHGRHSIAKVALTTTFCLVLFSCVMGVEALRMASHALPKHDKVEKVIHKIVDGTSMENIDEAKLTEFAHEIEHIYHAPDPLRERVLLGLALVLCVVMIFIACVKLWVDTHSHLELEDPMDHFKDASEALQSINGSL